MRSAGFNLAAIALFLTPINMLASVIGVLGQAQVLLAVHSACDKPLKSNFGDSLKKQKQDLVVLYTYSEGHQLTE